MFVEVTEVGSAKIHLCSKVGTRMDHQIWRGRVRHIKTITD